MKPLDWDDPVTEVLAGSSGRSGPSDVAGRLANRPRLLWQRAADRRPDAGRDAATDVSAPLLVLLAGGNTALGTVLNAVNTAPSPFIILFLWMTGIELKMPVLAVVNELVLIVVVATVIGVWLRTRFLGGVSCSTLLCLPPATARRTGDCRASTSLSVTSCC